MLLDGVSASAASPLFVEELPLALLSACMSSTRRSGRLCRLARYVASQYQHERLEEGEKYVHQVGTIV